MDEATRLAGLHVLRILDTAAEEPFDRLTRLAAGATGMPVACIALVDATRIWRKSMVGMDLIESPRDGSFCDIALPGEHALVVADAVADPRFAATEVVARYGARSYAGAPIRLASGAAVGTICVLDTVPRRDLGTKDAALLQGLAAAAGHLLDLRREMIERQVEQRARRPCPSARARRGDGRDRHMASRPRDPGRLAVAGCPRHLRPAH